MGSFKRTFGLLLGPRGYLREDTFLSSHVRKGSGVFGRPSLTDEPVHTSCGGAALAVPRTDLRNRS